MAAYAGKLKEGRLKMEDHDTWAREGSVFVAASVDYGIHGNGKADILGVFPTREEAERYVRNDMADYEGRIDEGGEDPDVIFDYKDLSAYRSVPHGEDEKVCEWSVCETKRLRLLKKGAFDYERTA